MAMNTLSKKQMMPLLAALLAVLSLGAAVGVQFLRKYLKRMADKKKRREARLALLAATRPKDASPAKLLHVFCVSLPDLKDGSEPRTRLDSIVEKMNAAFPCVTASFSNYGSKSMGKQALQGFLGKPDMSLFMTHVLTVVADDPTAIKLLLHSNLQKMEWAATGGPFFRGCMEIMTDLAVDFDPEGKEDPIVQYVLLRFKPEVTDDSEVYKGFLKAVADFRKSPGVAASLRPAGHHQLAQEELLEEIQWKMPSFLATHLLVVTADSPKHLKDLQSSEAYGKWLMAEMPHLLQNDKIPPALIFCAPLKLTAKC